MDTKNISIRGARVHNLKNVSVDIPRNKLVVATGPSGSGKSSLFFDTIYAEGQRRYLENISDYPKQFLNILGKPDVDQLEGLSPAISIGEKSSARSPRSTVGTMTEIYDYMRVFFSIEGEVHCPSCGGELKKYSSGQVVDFVMNAPKDARVFIMAPIVVEDGAIIDLIKKYEKMGYQRVRIGDEIFELKNFAFKGNVSNIEKFDLVIDRFKFEEKEVSYEGVLDSVESAFNLSGGFAIVNYFSLEANEDKEEFFANHLYCNKCEQSLPEIEPKLFSFNNPYGACPYCTGLGVKLEIDPSLVIPNRNLTLAEGALRPWANLLNKWDEYIETLRSVEKKYNIPLDIPVDKMSEKDVLFVLFGPERKRADVMAKSDNEDFPGAVQILEQKYYETNSDYIRTELEKYMVRKTCPMCGGDRLNRNALAVKVNGKSISDLTRLNIKQEIAFLADMRGKVGEKPKAVVDEIIKRLGFLEDIGLDYLSLMRSSETVSAGEARRVKLATQLSSCLQGITYILDEPSIGLHRKDDDKLLTSMQKLRDLGNSVLVVEHDDYFIRNADFIIDMGPKSGEAGGEIIAVGTPEEIMKSDCITGQYLSGRKKIEPQKKLRVGTGKFISIEHATEHNLKDVTVKIPLGKFVCVTGVSGSGKSTLINDILAKELAKKLHRAEALPGKCKKIDGIKNISKAICIDQSPIGRTPRSNPATYTGIFTHIRELFADTAQSKTKKFKAGHFSFNVKGGRCENCKGDGATKLEMYFLPDAYVECEQCHGKRYNGETLEVEYKGVNIATVLNMSVDQALEFFSDVPALSHKLSILSEVGLGYMRLGQSATTLSGGEAQRIKLATELARPVKEGKTMYILDEPTVGLHFDDTKKLLTVLNKLADRENTVLVIEHNMEVIKCADWIIDLGPDGGDLGGEVLFEGVPKDIMKCKRSYTGKYLKEVL
ncbi:MAG: excinuclease ABC subunit UvrA [Candidatus Paceibacterota bacterium]